MAFEKMTDNMNIISSLGDEPNEDNGLSASKLKEKFDTAGLLAKEAINKLISALGASTAAGNIGFASSTQVPAGNVQDAIDNVQAQLVGVSQGAVANGSITSEKLADGAVTAGKIAPGAIEFLDVSDQYQFVGGINTTGEEVVEQEFRYAPALGVVAFRLRLSVKVESENGTMFFFCADGPYTPRYNAYGEAVNASLASSRADQTVGVCAEISYVENLNGGNRYLNLHLYVSKAAQEPVVVNGWFFADEAEVT